MLLKDHHAGYIEWDEFEKNQAHIAVNAFGQKGGVKSGRGGRALLAGLLTCGRCGRRLGVVYSRRTPGHPYYRCERINQMLAKPRCMTFGASRIDPAIGREIMRAVTPMAIEAAMEAERMHKNNCDERRRMVDLDLQQARYEASLAERRYAACDPDNRLIAAQLEKSWEGALRRVADCEARLVEARQLNLAAPVPDFVGIAADLEAAWRAPKVDMRCRQQLLRALITDIIADVDEAQREVILTIHWKGGQHSQLPGGREFQKPAHLERHLASAGVYQTYWHGLRLIIL
ncbi:zinc ribbon domain-containing protein [Acidiphilium sp.]|uniref:zinc ribbon domain-containing protein n=1 Tax=Acidiphilium sp. TaxID=527 RepID=UPI00258E4675|nr:zinc ribbon domain-containing protein [Acidiphilium sp.]